MFAAALAHGGQSSTLAKLRQGSASYGEAINRAPQRNEVSAMKPTVRMVMHGPRWNAATLLLVAAGMTAKPSYAAFTQSTCPSQWYGYPIPVDIGTRQSPVHTMYTNSYGWNTEYAWALYTNSNVKQLAHSIGQPEWKTEQCCDLFKVFMKDSTSYTYSGTIPAGYQTVLGVPIPWNMQGTTSARYLSFRWTSDSSGGLYGVIPYFDEVKPMCDTAVNPTVNQAIILTNTRYDGLLLGTNDVIYLRFVQPANTYITLSLDVLAMTPSSSDFDLYVSTSTSTPDDSSYTYRGYHGNSTWTLGGAGEILQIPAVQSQRTLYVGVHSYSGAGHFSLHADRHYISTRYVCENFGFAPSQGQIWTDYAKFFTRTSLALSQATQGGRLINTWAVKTINRLGNNTSCWDTDSQCNDCITTDNCYVGTSEGNHTYWPHPLCGTVIDPWRAFVLAHEYGHSLLGLPDEYSGPWPDTGPFCGHSLMNNPSNALTLCTAKNHCLDPELGFTPPPGFDCGASGTMWSRIVASSKVPSAAAPASNMSADPSRLRPDNQTAQLSGNGTFPLVTVNKINAPY